jgi:putative ubiquitin-RnfH superfamily antitoxin RatB of RatAB toxin-antitoxin module
VHHSLFAGVLTWALGHVVDATTVEQVFDMSGATYKTKDDILTSAPLGKYSRKIFKVSNELKDKCFTM